MVALNFAIMCALVWYSQAQSGLLSLGVFKENAQLDGKMCLDTDVVFHSKTSSLIACSGRCQMTYGCLGIMYNRDLSKCVGCRRQYTNGTGLVTETGTKYFAGSWIEFNGRLYRLSEMAMNFTQAMDYCNMQGGHVARIDSDDKARFVTEILLTNSNFWIGLTDEDLEGTWTWINDGTVTNYTNWQSNANKTQPDGGTNTNCVVAGEGYAFRWADRNCKIEYVVLCEKQW